MPTTVQFRRGTTAQNDNFTGAVGEISVDTTLDQLRLHDGSTQGGFKVARDVDVNDRIQVANATSTFATWTALTSTNTAIRNLVSTEITNLVDTAPAALDTLNELAAALGDDANFATTVNNNISQKLGATATVTFVGDITGSNSFSSNATSVVTTLADTGTPTGTFGSGSLIPVITVDSKGRITNISNTSVAGVAALDYYGANSTLRITTADGGEFDTEISTNDKMSVANAQALAASRLGATASVTLTGDVTGSASFSSNAVSITTTVADDSHNHVISNVDGLQSALDNRMTVANTQALVNARLGSTASVTITGDVAGSASFSSNAVSIAVTQQNNSVDLGTHTTGNYVATISGTANEIEVSGSGSETAAVTIGLPNDVTVTGDLTVSGGDITLGGTGRIQGIDTVSAGTDAANKTYVDTAVANLVDSAPAALDTLNELAAALGDDANFATTVSTNIGQKLGATATVTLTGDVSGSASFSANAVSITTTVADDSHNHVISNVDGLQTALDGKQPLDADLTAIAGLSSADGNFIVGSASGWVAESGATARTSLGLGSLATLSAVGAAQITDNSVGAAELNVSGNGTTAQFLRSDGDGTFTWATPTDTNTTYSAGAGLDLSGTTFSVESDLRGDVSKIGLDTNDFYSIEATYHRWYLDGAEDMRLTNNGQLDVEGSVVAHSSTVSDERLKDNIAPIEGALDIVKQLNGVSFNYKKDGKPAVGLIAQDVEKVVPSAVQETEILGHEGEQYKILEYTQLIGVLVEAIKDQQEQIEELKSRL